MKKVIVNNKKVLIEECLRPKAKSSYLLIKTMYSTISTGTELYMIENSSNEKEHLGYSAMGSVVECGQDVEEFQIGDSVACYGTPYVHHSEYLLVPKTLCAKIPNNVHPKKAALAGIGAIAIHALRTAKVQFGETIIIAGLGILGQMIAKIANAAAHNVLVYDIKKERSNMLTEKGIKAYSNIYNLESELRKQTSNYGADAVLLCIDGKSTTLTQRCLNWVRDKGKVIIVGNIEPEFPRNLMFSKEAEILISRAGGPGRYDEIYEKQAIDYPYGFVRWTEGRNLKEYLRLVSENRIDVSTFTTEEIKFNNIDEAYDQLVKEQSTTLTKVINYIS